MTLIIPDIGEEMILRMITNNTPGEDLVVRLFTNNITPAETDVTGTYVEAGGFGYGSIQVPGGDWTFFQGAPSVALASGKTFTFTGALGLVYGYYLTQAISGKLIVAERFDVAKTIAEAGDQIRVVPRITAD